MESAKGIRGTTSNAMTWIGTLALLVSVSACTPEPVGNSGDDGAGSHEPAAACRKASPDLVNSISDGLTDTSAKLSNAQAVTVAETRRNERGFPEVVVAAKVPGSGVGSWSISADGSGPLMALNDVAQEVSEWGAAAAEGSPADQERDLWAVMPETAKAEECAAG